MSSIGVRQINDRQNSDYIMLADPVMPVLLILIDTESASASMSWLKFLEYATTRRVLWLALNRQSGFCPLPSQARAAEENTRRVHRDRTTGTH